MKIRELAPLVQGAVDGDGDTEVAGLSGFEMAKPGDMVFAMDEERLAAAEKTTAYEAFRSGVKLVRENLWKVRDKAGVKAIDAAGKKFDPHVHEALTAMPSSTHEPNLVLEVFQAGYVLDDCVLRPAKVIVSAAPPAAPPGKE